MNNMDVDMRSRMNASKNREANSVSDLNSEWLTFLQSGRIHETCEIGLGSQSVTQSVIEPASENTVLPWGEMRLHVSTQTKIVNLGASIPIGDAFWKIRVMDYHELREGVVKKQMKFNTYSRSQMNQVIDKYKEEPNASVNVILHVNGEDAETSENAKAENAGDPRVQQFRDVRKVNIGLCKKDVISSKKYKQKGAFYNCIVMTLRVKSLDNPETFQEVHVKVFNSGKLEIPGVKDDRIVGYAVGIISRIFVDVGVLPMTHQCDSYTEETILINSNFSCGFQIQRETLYHVLKNKYRITCNYDPCSYPGIQCKYYYYGESICQQFRENTRNILSGQKHPLHPKCKHTAKSAGIYVVSFFIFRTGSVLIVGRCFMRILREMHQHITDILSAERPNVSAIPITVGDYSETNHLTNA